MQKNQKYNIINWILGNLFIMLGVAFTTKASFGLSMIAAGPYILHVWLHPVFSWFTQGTAEYFYEAVLLAVLCIILHEFKLKYLLSFAEAFIVGLILDGWLFLLGGNGTYETMGMRIVSYILSLAICGLGVAFFFRTKMPLQVYDLAVVRIAEKYGFKQRRVKLCNDLIMLAVAILLALLLTGKLTGIGIGTFVTTLLNSTIIDKWGNLIDKVEARHSAEKVQ